MSTLTAASAPAPPPATPSTRRTAGPIRRWILLGAGVLLGLATVALALLLAVDDASNGTTTVLIGASDSRSLAAIAVLAALLALTVGLCAVPVSRRWLVLLVPARVAAVAATALTAFVGALTSGATAVPLISGGCDTGYVVREDSFLLAGWGTVYRLDGILATRVASTTGDDGYRPFSEGAYTVLEDGGMLRVWYAGTRPLEASPVIPKGDPAFVVPALTDRSRTCGLDVGTRAPHTPMPSGPAATLPPVSDVTLSAARDALTERASATLAAAVAPVRDAAGAAPNAGALSPEETSCDAGGARLALALDLTTGDNAASLDRILAEWDDAGYSRDRAMQEDIRYSDSLPVERLSVRDTTTIDGRLHVRMTTRCVPAG